MPPKKTAAAGATATATRSTSRAASSRSGKQSMEPPSSPAAPTSQNAFISQIMGLAASAVHSASTGIPIGGGGAVTATPTATSVGNIKRSRSAPILSSLSASSVTAMPSSSSSSVMSSASRSQQQQPRTSVRRSLLHDLFAAEPEVSDIDFEINARQRLLERASASASSISVSSTVRSNSLLALTAAAAATVKHKNSALTTILTEEARLPDDYRFIGNGAVEDSLASLKKSNNQQNATTTALSASVRSSSVPLAKSSAVIGSTFPSSLLSSSSSGSKMKSLLGQLNLASAPAPASDDFASFLGSSSSGGSSAAASSAPSIFSSGKFSMSNASSSSSSSNGPSSSVPLPSTSSSTNRLVLSDAEMSLMLRTAESLPSIAHALFLYANLYWTQIGGGGGSGAFGGGAAAGGNSNNNSGAAGGRGSGRASGGSGLLPAIGAGNTSSSSSSANASGAFISKARSVPIDDKLIFAVSPRCPLQVTRDHIEYVCLAYPQLLEAKWATNVPRLYFPKRSSGSGSGAGGDASTASSLSADGGGAGSTTSVTADDNVTIPTTASLRQDLLARYGNSMENVVHGIVSVSSYTAARRQQTDLLLLSNGTSSSSAAADGAATTRSLKAALEFANSSGTAGSASIISKLVGGGGSAGDLAMRRQSTTANNTDVSASPTSARTRAMLPPSGVAPSSSSSSAARSAALSSTAAALFPRLLASTAAAPKRTRSSGGGAAVADSADEYSSSSSIAGAGGGADNSNPMAATKHHRSEAAPKSNSNNNPSASSSSASASMPGVSAGLLSVLSEEKRRHLTEAMAVEDLFKNHNLSAILQQKVANERLLSCYDLISTIFATPIAATAGGGAQHGMHDPSGAAATTTTKNFMYGYALIQQLTSQNIYRDGEDVVRRQVAALIRLAEKGSGLTLQEDPCLQLLGKKSAATTKEESVVEKKKTVVVEVIDVDNDNATTNTDGDDISDHLRLTKESIAINGIDIDSGIIVLNRMAADRRALAAAIAAAASE